MSQDSLTWCAACKHETGDAGKGPLAWACHYSLMMQQSLLALLWAHKNGCNPPAQCKSRAGRWMLPGSLDRFLPCCRRNALLLYCMLLSSSVKQNKAWSWWCDGGWGEGGGGGCSHARAIFAAGTGGEGGSCCACCACCIWRNSGSLPGNSTL